MENDKIVHFVGFATNLPFSEFTPLWESYLNKSGNHIGHVVLNEADTDQKSMYQFISRHECDIDDFKFAFMKDGGRSSFPERKARVVQFGGYMPVFHQPGRESELETVCIIALVPFGKTNLDFILQLGDDQMNVYEAYFENCTYNYIVEIHLVRAQVNEFLIRLKENPGIETSLYKECFSSFHVVQPVGQTWK